MLTIRMQRTGRKGHAMFRMVVQDSRQSPSSGRVAAQLGNYDPHSKHANIDTEKAEFYLKNGAQPSDRVARLLKEQGVNLPKWVTLEGEKHKVVRNPEKLRKNQQPEAKSEAEPSAKDEQKKDESALATEPAEDINSADKQQEEPTADTGPENAA